MRKREMVRRQGPRGGEARQGRAEINRCQRERLEMEPRDAVILQATDTGMSKKERHRSVLPLLAFVSLTL